MTDLAKLQGEGYSYINLSLFPKITHDDFQQGRNFETQAAEAARRDEDMRHKVAKIAGLIAVATLAYGYWHVSTHGSLYVSLRDISDRQNSRPVPDAQLRFLDAAGTELAQAKTEGQYGTVYLSQPAMYACQVVEKQAPYSLQAREAWTRCFEKQSRWLMTWVRQVKYLELKAGSCNLEKIPVSVSEYSDSWWIWWVPLRHIGGKPYTDFSMNVAFNREHCSVN